MAASKMTIETRNYLGRFFFPGMMSLNVMLI